MRDSSTNFGLPPRSCDTRATFSRISFSGRKSQKRLSAFAQRLKALQDHLGALNDIKVDQKLAPTLVAGSPRTAGPQKAFAAGFVTGREGAEVEPLLKAADRDASKLSQIELLGI